MFRIKRFFGFSFTRHSNNFGTESGSLDGVRFPKVDTKRIAPGNGVHEPNLFSKRAI
jgi:hypothetical protein